jgi:predicted nucleic acid-binding protein
MTGERFFLDTSFVIALYNRRDRYHVQAKALAPRLAGAAEVWTTEAVLVEIGNAFSANNRPAAVAFIKQCFEAPTNVRVVSVDPGLFQRAVQL